MQDPKFIDVGGIKTRYFEAGDGEPVVLVQGGQFGWFNCATDWDLNFDELARDFHVFALDRIGQGHSDNPRDPSEYLLGTASQHLYDFIKAVGLNQAHLVGHSRGGYGVTRVALEHPEVVKSLVIVDSGSLMHQSAPFYDELDRKAAHITDTREMVEFKMVHSSYSGGIVSQGWVDDIMTFIETPKHRIAQETNAETKTVSRADHIRRQSESQEAIRNGRSRTSPSWSYGPMTTKALRWKSAASPPCTSSCPMCPIPGCTSSIRQGITCLGSTPRNSTPWCGRFSLACRWKAMATLLALRD